MQSEKEKKIVSVVIITIVCSMHYNSVVKEREEVTINSLQPQTR